MSRRRKQAIRRVVSCVCAMSMMAAVSYAQGAKARGSDEDKLVVLIKAGGTVPPQVLVRPAGATESNTIAFFHLAGGAFLPDGDAGSATDTARGGVVRLPRLAAASVGSEGYLTVIINREKVARRIRVATVSADDFALFFRALSLTEGTVSSSNAPLLANNENRRALGNPGAALRVGTDYLIFDHALVDPSGWSDDAVMVPGPGGTRLTAPDDVGTQRVCFFRSILGPGLVRWESLDPFYYSVKPEASQNLIWASAPDDAIDGIWNQWWGPGNAWKVPDYCTAYGDWGPLNCCCNAAATIADGGCRSANFNGNEHTWPYWPLTR